MNEENKIELPVVKCEICGKDFQMDETLFYICQDCKKVRRRVFENI